MSVVPTIKSLRKAFHSIAKDEMEKSFGRMKNMHMSERKEVELMVHRLVHKLLHDPSHNLKKISQSEDAHLYLDTLIKIFDLNPTPLNLEQTGNKQSRLKVIKS